MQKQFVSSVRLISRMGEVHTFQLARRSYTIGSLSDVDICIDDPRISLKHAVLEPVASDGWLLRVTGGRAKIGCQGRLVNRLVLRDGLQFKLGDSALVFHHRVVDEAELESDLDMVSVLSQVTPPKLRMDHLADLETLGQALRSEGNPSERLQLLCAYLCGEEVGGQWAGVLTLKLDSSCGYVTDACFKRDSVIEAPRISRTVLEKTVETGSPVLAANFQHHGPSIDVSFVGVGMQQVMVACPVEMANNQGPNVVYVVMPPNHGTVEWLALVALAVKQLDQADAHWAAQAAAVQLAKSERDLQNARRIQYSLLPKPIAVEQLELAFSYEPCEAVGGDIVDWVPLEDGRVFLMVADVTGHGLPASLTALSVHSIVQTCVRNQASIADVMNTLNRHFLAFLPSDRFVTMACLTLCGKTGRIEYLNAGHPAPLIWDKDGSVTSLPPADEPPLGLMETTYQPVEALLAVDQSLMLFSDGLIEIRQKDQSLLRSDGLGQVICSATDRDTVAIEQYPAFIRQAVDAVRLQPTQEDDETFLVIRRKTM